MRPPKRRILWAAERSGGSVFGYQREFVFMQDSGEGTYLDVAHIGDEHVS